MLEMFSQKLEVFFFFSFLSVFFSFFFFAEGSLSNIRGVYTVF